MLLNKLQPRALSLGSIFFGESNNLKDYARISVHTVMYGWPAQVGMKGFYVYPTLSNQHMRINKIMVVTTVVTNLLQTLS